MRLFERLPKRIWPVRHRDQVHMVRHQAVAQHPKAMQLRVLAQQSQIYGAISIVGENDLSGVSSLRHVVRDIDDYDA